MKETHRNEHPKQTVLDLKAIQQPIRARRFLLRPASCWTSTPTLPPPTAPPLRCLFTLGRSGRATEPLGRCCECAHLFLAGSRSSKRPRGGQRPLWARSGGGWERAGGEGPVRYSAADWDAAAAPTGVRVWMGRGKVRDICRFARKKTYKGEGVGDFSSLVFPSSLPLSLPPTSVS